MLFWINLDEKSKLQLQSASTSAGRQCQTTLILLLACVNAVTSTTLYLHTTLSLSLPDTPKQKISFVDPSSYITTKVSTQLLVTTLLPPSSSQAFSPSSFTQSFPSTQSISFQSNGTTFIKTSTQLTSTTSSTLFTTTLLPDFNRCLPINNSLTGLTINSTETVRGTVLKASCHAPYFINSRIGDKRREDVFVCESGLWRPHSPRCLEDLTDSNGGVVAGVVIGVILGLFILGGSAFFFYKMFKHKKFIEKKQDEMQTKIIRLNDFVYSSNEDYVGMPVVGFKSRNPDLRGVPLDDVDEEEPEGTSPSVPEDSFPYF